MQGFDDVSLSTVLSRIERRLSWCGGGFEVASLRSDDKAIHAEVVDEDSRLVCRLQVDRDTGCIHRA